MIVYISASKISTKKLQQMTNTFIKDTEHKINSKDKINSLPIINDSGTKKEIKKTKLFTTAPFFLKTLTKKVKDLYG